VFLTLRRHGYLLMLRPPEGKAISGEPMPPARFASININLQTLYELRVAEEGGKVHRPTADSKAR
jgi:hypothetical protein